MTATHRKPPIVLDVSGEKMSDATAGIHDIIGHPAPGFYESLNTHWHKVALQGFLAIVLFHWLEHIVQAYQFFGLHWTRRMFYQAQTQHFWFGGTVPTSIGQIWIPKIELHLIYNALVFIPMVVAMYYHVYPPARDAVKAMCTCASHRAAVGAAA